jgi:hypothetical protein
LPVNFYEVKKASLIDYSRSTGEEKNKQTDIDVVKLEPLFKAKEMPSKFWNSLTSNVTVFIRQE